MAEVRKVYDELQLKDKYFEYKKRNRDQVLGLINELMAKDVVLRDACLKYFDLSYDK